MSGARRMAQVMPRSNRHRSQLAAWALTPREMQEIDALTAK
jgi:hypothetical protein